MNQCAVTYHYSVWYSVLNHVTKQRHFVIICGVNFYLSLCLVYEPKSFLMAYGRNDVFHSEVQKCVGIGMLIILETAGALVLIPFNQVPPHLYSFIQLFVNNTPPGN